MKTRHPSLPQPSRLLQLSLLLVAGLWAARPALAAEPAHGKTAHAAEAPAAAKASQEPASAPKAEPVAAIDPLDQLRLRLASKLAGGKAVEVNGPYDLHVVAKSPASPVATHATRPALRAKAAPAGAHAAQAGHEHWSYKGTAGPQTWGGLKPEFTLCGSGQRQSPIDIRGGLPVDLDPVRFNYQASPFGVVDNGHTVQANVAPGNHIEVGGKRFELVQFHFHRPSEERIDGRQFELSVHLVHKDDQGRLAVVAVLMDKGPPQAVVQKVWNNLPLEKNEEMAARVPLDVSEILPTDRRYFTYMGSLTTPPCSEGVQWIVMRQPVTMSPEQIDLFARIYPMNSRPVQQASGRRILQSQ